MMSRFTSISFLVLGAFSFASNAFADRIPPDDILGEQSVFVEDVYAPLGYDPDDDIRIVVSGLLETNSLDDPTGQVEVNGNVVSVTVTSYRRASRIDHGVPRRFVAEVRLPHLAAGTYTVVVNAATQIPKQTSLEIVPTTCPNRDDHLYADVDTVTVDPKSRTIELTGEFPSACAEFNASDIQFISNGVNTYSVLPIMRKKNALCTDALQSFKVTKRLPDDLHAERILIHVRCLDGHAKNKIMYSTH